MKLLSLLSLIILASCAHHRGPAALDNQAVAHDSIALGNVKAKAVKRVSKQDVCFDVTLTLKGVPENQAQPTNWTVAWVDQKSHYHLLSLNQRDPASMPRGGEVVAPYGAYQEWTTAFTTCAPKTQDNEVKSLVLTPKELPYNKKDGLQLHWN